MLSFFNYDQVDCIVKQCLEVMDLFLDEGIDVSDGIDLDGDGRIKLFERGLENEKKGKLKSALKCYMACLRGLKPHTNFPLLPQCLRNVS